MNTSAYAFETAGLEAGEEKRHRLIRVVRTAGRRARQQPLVAAASIILVLIGIAAIAAPLVAPFDPLDIHPSDRLTGPGGTYVFGTDTLGRDVFSRVIWGARLSLLIGAGSVLLAVGLGTFHGILSGYMGGKVDMVLQRVADAMMGIPPLIFALMVMAMMGGGTVNVILAIGIVMAPSLSRVVRSSTLSVKQTHYVMASRAIGCTETRILLRHVLPNVIVPIIIMASSILGQAILAEATLSFLGMGTPPPHPSWGSMLSGSNYFLFEQAPWLVFFPGAALGLTVLAVNIVGDGLRDVLDPQMRNR